MQFIRILFRQLSWIFVALQNLFCPLANRRTAKHKFLTKLSCWEDSTLLMPQKPSLSPPWRLMASHRPIPGPSPGSQPRRHSVTKEAHLPKCRTHLSQPRTQPHRLVFALETCVVAKKLSGRITTAILNAKGTTSAFQKCCSQKNRNITTISVYSYTGAAERLMSRQFCESRISEHKALPQCTFAKSARLLSCSCSLPQNWTASASITRLVKQGQTSTQAQLHVWV